MRVSGPILFGVMSVAALSAACGGASTEKVAPVSSSTAKEAVHSGAAPINVTLKEFSIAASPASVAAGEVAFSATNGGTVAHEVVVLKTDKAAKSLPTKSDGTVDEEALNSVGEVNDLEPGKAGAATFRLAAGKYLLVCNLPGHYAAGMVTAFTVS